MDQEKPMTLSQMKKNNKEQYETVDMTQVRKISQQSKNEKIAKELEEQNKLSQEEILSKVDNRISRIKEENFEFNRLKHEEKVRRGLIEDDFLNSDNDISIPKFEYNGEEEMENNLEIYQENNSTTAITETNNKTYKSDIEIKEPVKTSSIDIEEVDGNQEENHLVIYDENSKDVKESDIIPENPASSSPVKLIEGKSHSTVMKSGNDISNIEGKNISAMSFDDEEHVDENKIDYIPMTDDIENVDEVKDIEFSDEDLDRMFQSMRSEIKSLLQPVTSNLDLSKFKIGKPININNVKSTRHKDIAEHVLWNAKRIFAMEEFDGFEINELVAELQKGGEFNQLLRKFTILYDHIRGKKPIDVRTWLKTTRADDLDHVYMGGFISSFKDSNILASQCEHCKAPYITKYIPIPKMMKFDSPEAEEKYYDILNNPDDSPYKIEGKGYRVSDDYLFSIKAPSIWKNNMESYLLEPEFREKYSVIINILNYVDVIYNIDAEKNSLNPIDYKSDIDPNDTNYERKVLKNKIKKYGKIIAKELNNAQYQTLLSYIYKEANSSEKGITYMIPERKCPACNHIDPSYDMTAEDLLFTQHQVAQLGSI